jgi:hypothetical protein
MVSNQSRDGLVVNIASQTTPSQSEAQERKEEAKKLEKTSLHVVSHDRLTDSLRGLVCDVITNVTE